MITVPSSPIIQKKHGQHDMKKFPDTTMVAKKTKENELRKEWMTYSINDQQFTAYVLTGLARQKHDRAREICGLSPSSRRNAFGDLAETDGILKEFLVPIVGTSSAHSSVPAMVKVRRVDRIRVQMDGDVHVGSDVSGNYTVHLHVLFAPFIAESLGELSERSFGCRVRWDRQSSLQRKQIRISNYTEPTPVSECERNRSQRTRNIVIVWREVQRTTVNIH